MRSLFLLATTLLTLPAFAEEPTKPGDDIVRYRQTVLGTMGRHMGAASMIVKEKVARPGDMLTHAQALHGASLILKDLFPADSHPDKVTRESEALATIWDKPDDFKVKLKAFEDASAALIEAAKTDDLDKMRSAFGQVGQSCGGCHDGFRKDD